jgi:hypothetical protein
MAKIAIVYPLSLEPTGTQVNSNLGRLTTYNQLETAFESCSSWIKQNLLEKFQGHEVDIYVFANYKNLNQANVFKKQLMKLYPIKDFILEPWENVNNEILNKSPFNPNRLAMADTWSRLVRQPWNLKHALDYIHSHYGEYDYYIKSRLDIFPGAIDAELLFAESESNMPWADKLYDYSASSRFVVTQAAIVTGGHMTPLHINDIQLFFDRAGARSILIQFDKWLDFTADYCLKFDWETLSSSNGKLLHHTNSGSPCYMLPENAWANLFFLSKVRITANDVLAYKLYRKDTYKDRVQLQHLIDNVNKDIKLFYEYNRSKKI